MEKQIISSFLEIAPDQSKETTMEFLEASNWDLENALNRLYLHEEIVSPPLPIIRDTLYDHYTCSYDEDYYEEDSAAIWDSDANNGTSTDLATLYRSPLELMFHGSFEEAKFEATAQDKWLLVNLQDSKEFDSHVMNRDLWSDEIVAETIQSSFLFWQADNHTVEGMKVCTYYKLDSFPVILVIQPITGQMMCSSKGLIQAEYLVMDVLQSFMEIGPKLKLEGHSHQAIIEEEEEEVVVVYPLLPEEPKGDKDLVCRVAIRVPDGRRFQRSFFREDPIQLLWSFCYYEIEEAKKRPFGLTVAIPGVSKRLDYDSELTFEKSGISSSVISLAWD